MAKKPRTPLPVGPVSPFWMPAPDKLLAAGFKPGGNPDCFIWEGATGGDDTQQQGRFWLYVWLKTKTSEIFLHHQNKPRAAEKPLLTTVGDGSEFTKLITRFGWKPNAKP